MTLATPSGGASAQPLSPNPVFAKLASKQRIERTVRALEANNIHAVVAENADAARKLIFDLIPAGAEVFTGASRTLDQLGIPAEIEKSGRYNSVRARLAKLDMKTQNREMVKLGATPEYILGSVHAVTEAGQVLVASNTGSQLGPYSAGAEKVIWVVGAHKLVKDLDEGMRRLEEYSLPLEDARLREVRGVSSAINKILIVRREFRPGRVTMILVKEQLGF